MLSRWSFTLSNNKTSFIKKKVLDLINHQWVSHVGLFQKLLFFLSFSRVSSKNYLSSFLFLEFLEYMFFSHHMPWAVTKICRYYDRCLLCWIKHMYKKNYLFLGTHICLGPLLLTFFHWSLLRTPLDDVPTGSLIEDSWNKIF